jgi:hypothetical protein
LLNSTLKKTQEDIIPSNVKHKFVQINRAELVNIDNEFACNNSLINPNELLAVFSINTILQNHRSDVSVYLKSLH